jgi:hypothetical protein
MDSAFRPASVRARFLTGTRVFAVSASGVAATGDGAGASDLAKVCKGLRRTAVGQLFVLIHSDPACAATHSKFVKAYFEALIQRMPVISERRVAMMAVASSYLIAGRNDSGVIITSFVSGSQVLDNLAPITRRSE